MCQEVKGQVVFSYEIALGNWGRQYPPPTLFPLLPLLVYKERDESITMYRLLSVNRKEGGRKSRLLFSYTLALGKLEG